MDEKVTKYIEKLQLPQQQICKKLREIILKNCPKIKETVMSEGLWYEGKFYLTSFKDHVNLGLAINGLSQKDLTQLEGKGKTLRHLKFYSTNDIDEVKLKKIIKLIDKKSNYSCQINWKIK